MDKEQDNSTLKIRVLLSQYVALRTETRIFFVLELIFLSLSILTFATLFIIATVSNEYVLLFVSPMICMLFVIIALGMFAYSTNLGLLASEIEDSINDIVGENLLKWESTLGVFGGKSKDVFMKKIGKFWFGSSVLGVAVVCILVISTLWYGFDPFTSQVGWSAWIFLLLDVGIIITTILIGYRIMTGSWRKIKIVQLSE